MYIHCDVLTNGRSNQSDGIVDDFDDLTSTDSTWRLLEKDKRLCTSIPARSLDEMMRCTNS